MGTKRVLIADTDPFMARAFAQDLIRHGFDCRVSNDSSQVKEIIEFWRPHYVFIDLLLPPTYALSVLRFVNNKVVYLRPKVFVMSKQSLPKEIAAMKRAGADHYIIKPLKLRQVLPLLDGAAPRELKPSSVSKKQMRELQLLQLFLKQATVKKSLRENLFNLMRMIGLRVGALRCSLTRFESGTLGTVMASNDDEAISGHKIDLANYPELLLVARTEQPLVVGNIRDADFLKSARPHLEKAKFETLAVFPVFVRGKLFGSLSLRLSQQSREEILYISQFGDVCAQIISLSLSAHIVNPSDKALPWAG